MNKLFFIVLFFTIFASCKLYSIEIITTSPDKNISINFKLNNNGTPQYNITFKGNTIIKWSSLGLKFDVSGELNKNLTIANYQTKQIDETYKIYSGKSGFSRNYCNETKIFLIEKSSPYRKLNLYFRAYNDGTAFRYEIPISESSKSFIINSEETFFNFTGDYECWAMKKDRFRQSYEGEYRHYNLSNIDNKNGDSTSLFPYITLPVTFRANDNLYFLLSEAAIIDYPGMYLMKSNKNVLKTKLSPDTVHKNISIRGNTPALSPWRLLIIGENPGTLFESNLIMNLNDPNVILDADKWIKPGKSTWSWWAEDRGFEPDFGYQILSTKTVKYCIDFAADNNFQYVTLDGGWYGWFDATKDDAIHDITKSLPELDLPEVTSYAAKKGIGIILWVVWYELERQMTEALNYYQSLGVKGVKVDFMDRDDQYMTDFYKRTAEQCASRKMFVTFHGAYKPDGLNRKYPNILTYESVLGNEYARWITGLPNPNHNVMLAFTRAMAGPMDFTPGSFTNSTEQAYIGRWKYPMTKGTRSQQLAMAVVYQSGILTLCESPKIYEKFPEFEFFKKISATWDSTLYLDGQIGEYIIIARRSGENWFIGGMTNNNSRKVKFNLDFLENDKYSAVVYSDASDADINPEKVFIKKMNVLKNNKIELKMAKGGGFAITLEKMP
ncbi:MAG: glycoside hydrolase family 97 protein [Ignavibacteria bacterium]|nr:glycoside hydrolase family 97 protein [Ignavibacteria bacterium]